LDMGSKIANLVFNEVFICTLWVLNQARCSLKYFDWVLGQLLSPFR